MRRLLRLLADPTRVRILAAVEGEELAVAEIAEVLGMGASRISNHLRLLREGGALEARREGHWTFYRCALGDRTGDARRELWSAVRAGLRGDPALEADRARRRAVLERRRRRSREYFAGTAPGGRLERGCLDLELVAALAPPETVVVDAGCGEGTLTALLAERFARVLAFDHSGERLRAARRRVPAAHVSFDRAEVDDLPVPDACADAFFLSLVLHHVPRIGAALAEAARVLRPGGRLVVAELAPHADESLRRREGDLRLGLDPAELEAALAAAGFEQVSVLGARDRLLSGPRRKLDLFLARAARPRTMRGRRRRVASKHRYGSRS